MTQDAFEDFIAQWKILLDRTSQDDVMYRGNTIHDIIAAVEDVYDRMENDRQ